MTPEQIHDALNLLPSDLITAADKMRNRPKKAPIRFSGWIATAACAALVLMVGTFAAQNFLPDMAKTTESIAEAPAAAMDSGAEMQNAAMDSVTLAPTGEPESAEMPAEDMPDGDHRHIFTDSELAKDSTAAIGGCGNTVTTIYIDGEAFSFGGSDSIKISRILNRLDYDPNAVCRCTAQFTVDTEMITGIEVNLSEGFARCELGQASLTKEQAETIQDIIDGLEIVVVPPCPEP